MRYSYRTGIKKAKTNITYSISTLVLVAMSLGGALPAFISKTAYAAGSHTVCATDCEFNSLQAAIDSPAVASGDQIQLNSNLTTTSQIDVTKSVTIDGQGHTVKPTFSKDSTSNNATILVAADYVSIFNITLDGSSSTGLHGINLYGVQGFSLGSATLTNYDHYGLVVNGSLAIVNDITTSGNGWGGIDVDQGTNVTSRANLAVGGYSNQSETIAIKIDDVRKDVSVDANEQYISTSAYPSLIYTQLQPQLGAENFNTVNDPTYKGISVGFNATNFVGSSLSGVTVEILRSDGTTATLRGGQDLLDLIRSNKAPHQFTAPFVIQAGSYDSSNDSYWQPSGHTAWTTSTVPVSATVTVDYGNGEPKTVTNTHFDQGSPSWPTYAELVPSTVPDAPVPTAPLNNSVQRTHDVTLSWKPSNNAVAYAIEISGSPEFRSGYGLDTGNVTSISPSNDPDLHSFDDGVYYWRIQARDADGHWGSFSPGQKFTVDTTVPADTTAPSVTKLRINGDTVAGQYKHDANCDPINQLYLVRGNVDLTAVINDGSDGSGVTSAYYTVRKLLDNGCTLSSGPNGYRSGKILLEQSTKNANNWNQVGTFDTNALNLNGKYSIELTTTDGAGNTTTKYINLNIDNTKPTISNIKAVVNPNTSASRTYSLTTKNTPLVVKSGDTVALTIKADGTGSALDLPTVRAYEQNVAAGNWHTYLFQDETMSDNGDGTYTYSFTVPDKYTTGDSINQDAYKNALDFNTKDAAGNTRGTELYFTIDNTAPTVSIDSYGQSGNTLQPTISVDGNTTPTGYTYSWSTDANVTNSNTSALNPTFTVNKYNHYSLTLTVTDAAGNSTVVPFNFVYSASDNSQASKNGKQSAGGFHNVSTTAPNRNGNQTPQQLTNNGTGTTTPSVLGVSFDKDSEVKGASTDTPSTTDTVTNVAATSTPNKDTTKTASSFLSIGWWWLFAVIVIAGLVWTLLGRGANHTDTKI